MKLSVWAKKQGVCYKTAWRWWSRGELPVKSRQMPTGTVILEDEAVPVGSVVVYARVSSGDQKSDLDRQVARTLAWANERKLSVADSVCEVGSALNGSRTKLMKLLRDRGVGTIIVEHRERLMRFGFEYLEATLLAQGRKILVVEEKEVKDDLVRDMIEVLTSFCARLYGRRAAANRATRAVEAMKKP